ncbi:MAG: hypothetical protein U9Q79_01360, partial [Candidatus Hydrogenedentes bacterium]|nr:hypothetical protein [Candidatus Hydrogenedentota bacterium]
MLVVSVILVPLVLSLHVDFDCEPFALWVGFGALAIFLADFPCGMAGAEELMFRCPKGFPLLLTRVCP